jgi:hypothetical protein
LKKSLEIYQSRVARACAGSYTSIEGVDDMMRRWGEAPTMTSAIRTGLGHNRINTLYAPSAIRVGARYDPDGMAEGHRAQQSSARVIIKIFTVYTLSLFFLLS